MVDSASPCTHTHTHQRTSFAVSRRGAFRASTCWSIHQKRCMQWRAALCMYAGQAHAEVSTRRGTCSGLQRCVCMQGKHMHTQVTHPAGAVYAGRVEGRDVALSPSVVHALSRASTGPSLPARSQSVKHRVCDTVSAVLLPYLILLNLMATHRACHVSVTCTQPIGFHRVAFTGWHSLRTASHATLQAPFIMHTIQGVCSQPLMLHLMASSSRANEAHPVMI